MGNFKAIVANPAKRKKKTARRKMSALQLKYFGAKRRITKRKKTASKKPKIKIIEVKSVARKRVKRARKSYTPKPRKRRRVTNPAIKRRFSRRRTVRNPSSMSGILDILVNGAFGGAGAFGTLFISDIIADKFLGAPANVVDAAGKAKRNIATILLALVGGWAALKFVKGKKGDALATGCVTGAMLRIAVNTFNLPIGLGESNSAVDSVLDNLLQGETLLGQNDQTLLGMDDSLFGDEMESFDGEEEDYQY